MDEIWDSFAVCHFAAPVVCRSVGTGQSLVLSVHLPCGYIAGGNSSDAGAGIPAGDSRCPVCVEAGNTVFSHWIVFSSEYYGQPHKFLLPEVQHHRLLRMPHLSPLVFQLPFFP